MESMHCQNLKSISLGKGNDCWGEELSDRSFESLAKLSEKF